MEATRDDIEGLFELQRIDLEIKRLSKELDELPQRGIIVAARDKKTAIEARGQVEAKVSPQLLDVYNRTAARSGVAIGVLDGNRCGACRTVIDGGRLIDLRNQAPLGMCPSCKRLLVIA